MMEIKKRELDARIYFAMKAASMGYSACFGKKSVIYYYRKYLTKGLVFFKSLGPNNTILIDRIKSAGHKILAWDEEGMTFIPEDYNDRRLYEKNFKKVELFFSWGKMDTDIIKKYQPNDMKKVFMVGNSRIDVLKSPFNKFYNFESKRIKEKYGNFILFPTVFTRLNRASIYDIDAVEGLKRIGIFKKDSPSLKIMETMKNQQGEILKVFIEYFKWFSNECPNVKLIVRPHPSENINFWFNLLKEYKNIEVVFDAENTSSWIAASDFLISTNCSTAIEAFFLGKKAVNFLPYKDEYVEYKLPKILSTVVRDLQTLKEITKSIELKKTTLDKVNARQDIINEWICNAFSHCSVEKTVNILEKNEDIASFFKKSKEDKFSNKYFFIIFSLIKKMRLLYHRLFTKKTFARIDVLIDQKFPSLNKDEIEYRVNFFSQFFKNKKFIVKELYPGVFSID